MLAVPICSLGIMFVLLCWVDLENSGSTVCCKDFASDFQVALWDASLSHLPLWRILN
jgi:hypothetical protein